MIGAWDIEEVMSALRKRVSGLYDRWKESEDFL